MIPPLSPLNSQQTADAERFPFLAARQAEDAERFAFLHALDAAPFEITDWESKFIESLLVAEKKYQGTGCRSQFLLSPKQREKVDQLRSEYQGRLGNLPLSTLNSQPSTPAPVPGQCAWLLRQDNGGPQTRCGRPAATVRGHDLELCADHAAERDAYQRHLKERRP